MPALMPAKESKMLSASGQSETRVATTQAVLCDALLTLAFASYHLSRRLFANSVSLVCAQQIVTTNVESEEAVRSICRSLTASVRQQPDRLDVCSILVVVVVLKAGLGFLYIRRRSVPNTESFVVTSSAFLLRYGHTVLTKLQSLLIAPLRWSSSSSLTCGLANNSTSWLSDSWTWPNRSASSCWSVL